MRTAVADWACAAWLVDVLVDSLCAADVDVEALVDCDAEAAAVD